MDQTMTFKTAGYEFEVTVDDLLSNPGVDIRAEIIRHRAEAIAAADDAGIPRRPLGDVVQEFAKADLRRLAGFRVRNLT
jgi:elongation factor P hydroxylase